MVRALWRYYARIMSDTTDPNAPPAPAADPSPAPPAPTLTDLAKAVLDAQAAHASALAKSNASATQAATDQGAESAALQAFGAAKQSLIDAVKNLA